MASKAQKPLLRLSLISLASFVSLMLLVKFKPQLFSFDAPLAQGLYSVRTTSFDNIMLVITQIGDSTSLISISTVLALMLFALRLWKTSLICIAGFLTSTLTVGFIKVFVNRARPINDLYTGSESFSFPSGHMTNTTVVLGTLGVLLALSLSGIWRKIVLSLTVTLIILVGLSRVYLGAHWPSDILGGALLGTTLLVLIQLLISHFDRDARRKIKAPHMLVMTMIAALIWVTHVSTNKDLPKYNLSGASPASSQITIGSN